VETIGQYNVPPTLKEERRASIPNQDCIHLAFFIFVDTPLNEKINKWRSKIPSGRLINALGV